MRSIEIKKAGKQITINSCEQMLINIPSSECILSDYNYNRNIFKLLNINTLMEV